MIRRALLPVLILPASLFLLGVALAVPAAAGGGCHGTGAVATEATSTVVKIDGCAFAPTIDRVAVGTAVAFLNSGLVPHDVTGNMGEWGSPMLQPGATYAYRFATPGIYAYSCSLHPGMAGVVVAGDFPAPAADAVPAGAAPAAVAVAAEQADSAAASTDPMPGGVAAAFGAGVVLAAVVAGIVVKRRQPSPI